MSQPVSPLAMMAITGFIVGGIGFVGGFVGPMLLSDSNLGPLLGIFFTGPAGFLVGAVAGGVLCAWRARQASLTVWMGLAWIWAASLLYTLFMIRFGPMGVLFAIAAQAAVLAGTSFLLYSRTVDRGNLHFVRAGSPIVLAALGLVLMATLFPPVTRPWWGTPPGGGAETLPPVAFLFHPGFDASRHVPHFAVNEPVLMAEWLGVAAASAAACLFMRWRMAGEAPGRSAER